jgi:hypothetical protein
MPSAKVTLTCAVGDINSGKSPIKLEIKIKTANVATTGKYLNPCSPITLTTKSLQRQKSGFERQLSAFRIVFGKFAFQNPNDDHRQNTRDDEHYRVPRNRGFRRIRAENVFGFVVPERLKSHCQAGRV